MECLSSFLDDFFEICYLFKYLLCVLEGEFKVVICWLLLFLDGEILCLRWEWSDLVNVDSKVIEDSNINFESWLSRWKDWNIIILRIIWFR